MSNQEDFSIIFKSLEESKNASDYPLLEDAMCNTNALQDPIEKLREIVMDSEKVKYSVIITA